MHSQVIARLLENLKNNTGDLAPTMLRSGADFYTDIAAAETEHKLFFSSGYHLLALSSDIPDSGSFFLSSIADTNVILTRDSDMQFRAYHNVCSHRGNIVEKRLSGNTENFTCRFHRWSYGLDGRLVTIPNNSEIGEVDKTCDGLVEFQSVEINGMLWVSLDNADVEIDVDQLACKEFMNDMKDIDLSKFVNVGSYQCTSKSNWKIALEGFGETHHFQWLHRKSLGSVMHSNTYTFDAFGPDYRLCGARRENRAAATAETDTLSLYDYSFVVWYIFPNTIVIPTLDSFYLMRIYPVDKKTNEHAAYISFYSPSDVDQLDNKDLEGIRKYNETADKKLEEHATVAMMFASIVEDEDYPLYEPMQKSYESHLTRGALLGRNEPALQHLHTVIRAALSLPPAIEI